MKNKTLIIIILILTAIFVPLLIIYFFFGQKPLSSLASPKTESTTPVPTIAALVSWADPAGFSFKLAGDIKTNKHEEDSENYAHLELSHTDHPGNLVIWVKDLPRGLTDVKSWVKSDKAFSSSNIVKVKFSTTWSYTPVQ